MDLPQTQLTPEQRKKMKENTKKSVLRHDETVLTAIRENGSNYIKTRDLVEYTDLTKAQIAQVMRYLAQDDGYPVGVWSARNANVVYDVRGVVQ